MAGALFGSLAAPAAALAAVLLVCRCWRVALPVAVASLCAFGAEVAWSGLDGPLPPTAAGSARLVTDPADEYGAVRAEVVLEGRHWDLWARGPEAAVLARASAGESVHLEGRPEKLRGRGAPYLRRRHIAGRIQADEVAPGGRGGPAARVANWVRRSVDRGADHLPDPTRGLFAGMVLGDDRHQDSVTEQRFRAAGLSHLLVVSGQNVAFVLALFSPLVARGATGTRLLWTLGVLALFGTVVRWDPSVMRAVAMAGLVAGARAVGASPRAWALLCAAVTALLIVDPLLAGSVSFLLSVAASAGLALITPVLVERLRGPRALREVLGSTLGAQLAVAPLLLAVFGSVPLVSVPANLLAAPAAGPAMTWGMAAGVPAGLLGEPAARWLHAPTRVLVGWVDRVAIWASDAPAPVVRAPGRPPTSPRGSRVIAVGGATVVVVDDARPELVGELRGSGITRIDLLVMTRSTPRAQRCADSIRAALSVRRVLGPPGSDRPALVEVGSPGLARAGPIQLNLTPVGDRLRVEVSVGSGE